MFEEYGDFGKGSDWKILRNGTKLHRTALVASWVRFDDNCVVRPYAIVGREPDQSKSLARESKSVKIITVGARTVLGCFSILYSDVVLGEDCLVGDYASIREGSRIGNRCVVGRQVTINYNVIVGDETRFQDGTHITGDCVIGKNCFFGPGVITSNDRKVDLEDYHFPIPPQPCLFGDSVLVGSGSNILAGVRVGNKATIAAGSLVVKDVEEGEMVMGWAAMKKKIAMKNLPKAEIILVDSKPDAELIFDNCTQDLSL